jgi:hypothetical protein
MDDPNYFDSLEDDSIVGSTVSGILPGSYHETEYRGDGEIRTRSQGNDGTTFAAATPSSLGHRTSVRNRSHVENSTTKRERYWKNNAPVLEKLDWNSTTFLLPRIAPYTEATKVKQTIHKRTTQAISNNQASWQDKAEVIANRFQHEAPRGESNSRQCAHGHAKLRK